VFDKTDLGFSIEGKFHMSALLPIAIKVYRAQVAKGAATVGKWLQVNSRLPYHVPILQITVEILA
jgi:hypothetical protein